MADGAIFPVNVLPFPLRRFIEETAQALPCAVDMVAVPALAAASVAIGASRKIRIKGSWMEPAALFVAVVAPTGSLKTPAVTKALFPVFEQEDRFEQGVVEQKAREKADGNEPEECRAPRTYTSDVTVEGLGQLFQDNPYGLLLYRDELSGWVQSMDQYRNGKGADRQFFLSAWSGTRISSDRVGRPRIRVPLPFLSIVGGIPPDILPELADGQGREDGFLPRLLFAFPEQVSGRFSRVDVSSQVQDDYASLVYQLYELEFEEDSQTGKKQPVILAMTSDGLEKYVIWHDRICLEMEVPTLSPVLKGFYAKLKGYCGRLALIHALCVDPNALSVGVGNVDAAIAMTEYFKCQAEKVCALLAQPKKTPLERCEREILRNLSHGRIITKRQLQQGGNAEAAVFKTVFDQLVASGKIVETQKTGKKHQVRAYQLANQG